MLGLPFNALIVDIGALPDDASQQEIKFHIFKAIGETGQTIDAVLDSFLGCI
jgi:hypothetical protein